MMLEAILEILDIDRQFDGLEHGAVARHRYGGSVRRLWRIVETILHSRDIRGTRN
jgi:hypothetical protein